MTIYVLIVLFKFGYGTSTFDFTNKVSCLESSKALLSEKLIEHAECIQMKDRK